MSTTYNQALTRKKSFEDLALPLKKQIYGMALKMTKNRWDAEDLLQDTFLKAYRFFHRFQAETNIRAWMLRILTNNFITEYNSKKREPVRVDFEKTCAIQAGTKNDGDFNCEALNYLNQYDEVFDDKITRALDRLPQHYRTAVLLADIYDFQYDEIAEMADCPIGTVMSRINRGRKMLARSLKSYVVANGFIGN